MGGLQSACRPGFGQHLKVNLAVVAILKDGQIPGLIVRKQ